MKTNRIVPIFCLFTGCSIAILWIMLLATNQVVELATEPIRIYMHLTSEFLLAVLLVTSGIMWLRDSKHKIFCLAFTSGMLLYSTLNAAGYYAGPGTWFIAGMLLTFGFLGLFLLLLVKYQQD